MDKVEAQIAGVAASEPSLDAADAKARPSWLVVER
jgi:hypothetical protein